MGDDADANAPQRRCRVFNASGFALGGSDLWFEWPDGRSTTGPRVEAGGWGEVREGCDVGSLRLSREGLRWQGVDGDTVPAAPGLEHRVVANYACPPLTEEEKRAAMPLVLDMVEGALRPEGGGPPLPVPVAAPLFGGGDADAQVPEAWRRLTTLIGRDGAVDSVAKKVREMVCNATCYAGERRSWSDVYDAHPRRPVVVADPALATEALESGRLVVDVCHRAMDRFPGGNCDVHSARHAYRPGAVDDGDDAAGGAAGGGGEASVRCRHYSNWDGSSYLTVPFDREAGVAEAFAPAVDALRALLGGGAGRDVEVSIVDPAIRDSDEYDTKWSSVEVLLFDEARERLLARVHQRAVLERRDGGPQAATAPVQSVLDAIEGALRMGKVEAFSEDMCHQPPWKDAPREAWAWHGYVTPVFIPPPE